MCGPCLLWANTSFSRLFTCRWIHTFCFTAGCSPWLENQSSEASSDYPCICSLPMANRPSFIICPSGYQPHLLSSAHNLFLSYPFNPSCCNIWLLPTLVVYTSLEYSVTFLLTSQTLSSLTSLNYNIIFIKYSACITFCSHNILSNSYTIHRTH